jgi:hypothetical protein
VTFAAPAATPWPAASATIEKSIRIIKYILPVLFMEISFLAIHSIHAGFHSDDCRHGSLWKNISTTPLKRNCSQGYRDKK